MYFLLLFFYFKLFLHTITASLIRLPLNKQPHNNDQLLKKRGGGPSYTSLYHDMHSLYLIQIGIGTPKQLFYVSIDTGSADLWVSNIQCPISSCPVNRFDSTSSTSFKEMPSAPLFNITYGSGTASGKYITESVTIGGFTIEQQQIALATYTNNIFKNNNDDDDNNKVIQDGIFGLGYPNLTVAGSDYHSPYLPFLFQLMEQKVIDQPIFSIYLNNSNTITDGWGNGELAIGGYDAQKFIGDIYYVPIMNPPPPQLSQWNGYWMIGSLGYSFINQPSQNKSSSSESSSSTYLFQQNNNHPFPTVIDTGAMISYFPLAFTQSILNDIFGNDQSSFEYDSSTGHYTFTSLSSCQSLKNQYQSYYLQFYLSSFNDQPIAIQVPIKDLFVPFHKNCIFGIAATTSTIVNSNQQQQQQLMIFGDSILKSTYLVFDIGKNQIGFATPNHNGTILSSPSSSSSNNTTNNNHGNNTGTNGNNGDNVTSHANTLMIPLNSSFPSLLHHYIYLLLFLSLLFI